MRKPRPRRGSPDETRTRLIAAAAASFNRDGYFDTDTVRIAREAGYAAGTFYKHFPDKRAVLLAAYESWVTTEWRAIEKEVAAGGVAQEVADRIVRLVLDLHVRWPGLRASLAAVLTRDAEARRFHREQRRRQLEMVRALRARRGARPRASEEDAVLLFALERTCDAIATGEVRALGLSPDAVLTTLRDLVERALVST